MDRDTLIAALVGAGIATIPILLSNIVQIILHISDNRQKRRSAKIQAKEKWIERDILKMMDLVEGVVRLRGDIDQLKIRRTSLEEDIKSNPRKKNEISATLKTYRDFSDDLFTKLNETTDKLNILMNSFSDKEMLIKCGELFNSINKFNKKSDTENWLLVGRTAGILHELLRNKLISLRE
jgi:hypothetical protein